MTTETETPSVPEAYPWDRYVSEPYIPNPTTSLAVVVATPLHIFDSAHHDMDCRVVGIAIGGVTLHIGVSASDEEIVTIVDRLIEPLQELRFAAKRRIADGPVPA